MGVPGSRPGLAPRLPCRRFSAAVWDFFDAYVLRAVGTYGEVWVQENLFYPDGDPRNTPGVFGYPEVTDEQVDYLLSEFDNNIYFEEAAFYGPPDARDGSVSLLEAWGLVPPGYYTDSDGKTAILISNVRDEAYFDPGYPLYIAGFYSSQLEDYYDRNAMTIDSHDWINRVGPDGSRPYLYEGTFAHEYQHLIHSDYIPGDDSFVNEGFSDYAEYLTGYGIATGHINSYLENPANSLTEWGDLGPLEILGDYGAAALFTHWLEDHFPGYQSQYYQNGITGAEGVVQAVADITGHSWWTFESLARNWRIANLIHSDYPGHGLYNYESLDLGSEDFSPLFVEDFVGNEASGVLNSYGTSYFELQSRHGLHTLTFDGADSAVVVPDPGWTETIGEWYSGGGDLIDRSIQGEVYVDPADPTLVFDTYIDIEDYWDFGFVQVSTDGGATWISLENEYTTAVHDPSALPAIIEQLPGLTTYIGSVDDMTFNLIDYAGQTVLLSFRFMTDWNTYYEGWYVWDITVSGAPVTLANYVPPPPEVDFVVTLVGVVERHGRHKTFEFFTVGWDMWLADSTEFGKSKLFFFDRWGFHSYYFAIISPVMEDGSADFSMTLKKNKKWHW
jgi:hypothetical protein